MATIRPEWEMPESPVEGSIPGFYNDGNEIWLHWVQDTEEHLPVEAEGVEIDIPWPFIEGQALHTDLEALGFTNTDA